MNFSVWNCQEFHNYIENESFGSRAMLLVMLGIPRLSVASTAHFFVPVAPLAAQLTFKPVTVAPSGAPVAGIQVWREGANVAFVSSRGPNFQEFSHFVFLHITTTFSNYLQFPAIPPKVCDIFGAKYYICNWF